MPKFKLFLHIDFTMLANRFKVKPEEYASPLDAPYVQKIIFTLSLIGAWPHDVLGYKKRFSRFRNSKVLICFWGFITLLIYMYLGKYIGIIPFLDLGKAYVNALMGSVAVIYEDVHSKATMFTNILQVETYCGLFLYNVTPVFISYQRGMFQEVPPENATYDQPCHFEFPFINHQTEFKGYLFVCILNCLVSSDVCCCILGFDVYMSIIGFHIWGHIKLLKHNLRHFPRPKMRGLGSNSVTDPAWYDEEESKEINALLVDNIEHHKMIRKFMNQFSMAFGLTICFYTLFQQIAGCILLVELSQLTPQAFGNFGILSTVFYEQLIQLAVIFEFIATQSETIKDAVYDVPWECMGTNNRKTVLILLRNVQESMALKALGMLPIGVKTMASILKTTLSYYMLLRASVSR